MIKTTLAVLVSAVSLSLGCSSSSSTAPTGGGSGGGSSTGCVQGSAMNMDLSCLIADTSGLTAAEVSSLNTNCTNDMGTVVTACPTADLVGCCTTTLEGTYTSETCTYSGTAADGQSACTAQSGRWTTSQ